MKPAAEAFEKLKNDLAWRGPNDKPMGHAVLNRFHAEALVELIERLAAQYVLDHGLVALRKKFGIEARIKE